jgi:hypothetical protein
VTNYELVVGLALEGFSSSNRRRPRSLRRTIRSGIHTATRLDGTVLRSALGAKPPKNEFTFANDPLAEGSRGRLGHVVPLNVLNIPAAVANEVMMQQAFGIESRGTAFDRHFTHQARLHQVTQIVISRGPGGARIHAIHGFEDFDSGGMPVVFRQEGHHGVALWSAAQSAAFQ